MVQDSETECNVFVMEVTLTSADGFQGIQSGWCEVAKLVQDLRVAEIYLHCKTVFLSLHFCSAVHIYAVQVELIEHGCRIPKITVRYLLVCVDCLFQLAFCFEDVTPHLYYFYIFFDTLQLLQLCSSQGKLFGCDIGCN